jgi:outer membrane lipoprotein-sorting protein
MNLSRIINTGIVFLLLSNIGMAQNNATVLVQKLKLKLDQINDYQAKGQMKTNISFLKVPVAEVEVFFKSPNKLKIKNEKGISLVPKGTASISLNNLLGGQFQALDAGTDKINGTTVKVIKLLPLDNNSDIAVSTLYVDEARLLILKAVTTTKDSGTNELELFFRKYAAQALPDKIIFTFSTKDYKLPKGITFDYDDGTKKAVTTDKSNKGKIEITYTSYSVNKGLADSVFK